MEDRSLAQRARMPSDGNVEERPEPRSIETNTLFCEAEGQRARISGKRWREGTGVSVRQREHANLYVDRRPTC